MWLDIGLCVFLALCAFFGWRTGFMRGIIGFVSSTIAFVSAIFLAKPLADLFEAWFNMSELLDFNKVITGRLLNLAICFILTLVVIRLMFWGLSRFIKIIKKENKLIDRIDKVAGVVLGVAKGLLTIMILSVSLGLLDSIPFIENALNAAFNKSVIGHFLYYDVAEKVFVPIVTALAGSVINTL